MVFNDTRSYIIDRVKSRKLSIDEFNWEKLWAPPIAAMFTPQDIEQLRFIASSLKLSAKTKEKFKMIDDIMYRRGFVRFVAGTNRITYKCIEDDRFLVKVAYNNVGRQDAPREFKNQFALKPFVTRVFEYTPCGTLAVCERVNPITSREEYMSVAEDIFTLINDWLLGEYVLDDIGSEYFMNYGLRLGFGIVLLDYPYMFKVDYGKLTCTLKDKTGSTMSGCCEGEIDYDDGYNKLICKKCGAIYKAIDLAKAVEDNKVIIKHTLGGIEKMELKLKISGGSKNMNEEKVIGGNMFAKSIPLSKPIVPSKIQPRKEETVAVNGVETTVKEEKETKTEEIMRICEVPGVKNKDNEDKTIKEHEEEKVEDKKAEEHEIVEPIVIHDPDSERIKEIAAEADKKIKEIEEKKEETPKTTNDIIREALLIAFDEFEQHQDSIDEGDEDLLQVLSSLLCMINPSMLAAAMKTLIEEYEHLNYEINVNDIIYSKEDDKDLVLVDFLFSLILGSGEKQKRATVDILNGESAQIGISMDMIKKIANEHNLSLSDPDDENKIYDGFKEYAAKNISRKDIVQDESTENVIALIGEDGNFITDREGKIISVAKLDGKNVSNLSFVSNNWYRNAKKQLEEIEGDVKHAIPVGAAPNVKKDND